MVPTICIRGLGGLGEPVYIVFSEVNPIELSNTYSQVTGCSIATHQICFGISFGRLQATVSGGGSVFDWQGVGVFM